jgi:hypothetical protein
VVEYLIDSSQSLLSNFIYSFITVPLCLFLLNIFKPFEINIVKEGNEDDEIYYLYIKNKSTNLTLSSLNLSHGIQISINPKDRKILKGEHLKIRLYIHNENIKKLVKHDFIVDVTIKRKLFINHYKVRFPFNNENDIYMPLATEPDYKAIEKFPFYRVIKK